MISACMITKNESEFLEASIKSFIDYVDELIIIDDNSTDGTQDIAKKYNAKLITGAYNGDKATQRNEYLKHAKCRWIFCPDGDEVFFEKDMKWLREFAQSDRWNLSMVHLHTTFWKDFHHVIRGHVWQGLAQRFYKNIEGLGYYDLHHSVSIKPGKLLTHYATEQHKQIKNTDMTIPHYSYCKKATAIRDKIEYYMRRDNPNCKTDDDVIHYAGKHPFFCEYYSYPRYGEKGLYCCGSVGSLKDHVEPYAGDHPEAIKEHPKWEYLYEYSKNMNDYMENHWQFHNHLDHERHQNRLKYTASFCIGETVEIGCANGFSTRTMQDVNSNAVFSGVEPTSWGFTEARRTYPDLRFYRYYGENLGFREDVFDTSLLSEVIEHTLYPRKMTDEAWRVAKKRMIVTTPTKMHPDPDHKRFYTIRQMKEFLKPYGEAKICGLKENGNITTNADEIYFMIAVVDKDA